MSRVRGIFPLFLATTFGIVNGIGAFGPAFKEQQQEKEEQARKAQEVARLSEEGGLKTLREAEAAASRTVATESALRSEQSPKSWWPSIPFWSNASSPQDKTKVQNHTLEEERK